VSRPGRSGAVAALIEPALAAPALVFGGLPPAARDLDVLVRDDDVARLAAALTAAGFAAVDGGWVRLGVVDGELRADCLDITVGADWALPAAEMSWLWSTAVPILGYAKLRRPGPAAVLLVLAVRYGSSRRQLTAAHRARVRAALAEDAEAFARAAERAPSWRARVSLEALRAACETGRATSRRVRYLLAREQQAREAEDGRLARLRALRRAVAPKDQRGSVVAVCGPEPAAREAQVALLLPVLADLGVAATLCRGPWPGVPARPRDLLRLRRSVRRVVAAGRLAMCAGYAVDAVAALRRHGAGGPEGLRARLVDQLLPAPAATFLLTAAAGGADAELVAAYRRAADRVPGRLVAPPDARSELDLARWLAAQLWAMRSLGVHMSVPPPRAQQP